MYHHIYPGIRIWYDTVKRALNKDRTLINCFGRRVRFMDRWGDDLFKSAYSMLPQSTVVDSLNQGMVKIYNDNWLCGVEGLNIDILAQVHDSILLQVPIQHLKNRVTFEAMRDRLYDFVSPDITYNGRTFKIATDMKIGMNWSGMHKEHNPLGMVEVKDATSIPGIIEKWESMNVPGPRA
jgi:DNA polymerase I-like protein with 3'-5' exonuclease and polymerase domains